MRARESLDVQIERLYQAFGVYGLSTLLDDADSDEESAILQTTPLRELPEPLLQVLPYQLLNTAGTLRDVKHLLPRILEAGARGLCGMDPQIGRMLRRAEWWSWPAGEVDETRAFFRAYWDFLMESEEGGQADPVLSTLANLEDDLQPYLERWVEAKGRASYLALARLALRAGPAIQQGHARLDVMWEGRERQWEQVAVWLAAPRTLEHLEKGYFATELPIVSDACEVLRVLSSPKP